MKIISLVGARPQFIKASVVCRALEAARINGILVHSGQHYDSEMSTVFFDQLDIPVPDRNLGVGSGTHAYQTALIMERFEDVLQSEKPAGVIIYGDTNTTLGGALVAAKCCVPVAHVEAGLRSFDRTMPEEINRVVADTLSSWLFCPTDTAVTNLESEGVQGSIHLVGDVMYDAVIHLRDKARNLPSVIDRLGFSSGTYVLLTIHRDFNTDNTKNLRNIIEGVTESGARVVFPAHPRTRKQISKIGLLPLIEKSNSLSLIDPVGYLEMMQLEMGAKLIMTDSGGVQKEAYFHGVPCVTIRPSTEWVELVDAGWNTLVPARVESIARALSETEKPVGENTSLYGDGNAGVRIAEILAESLVLE